MARRKKETPLKYCESCGKKLERKRLPNGDLEYLIHFNRRKYCNRECMANGFRGVKKSENLSCTEAHKRARELVKKTECSKCGSKENLDIHHKDGDFQNNS